MKHERELVVSVSSSVSLKVRGSLLSYTAPFFSQPSKQQLAVPQQLCQRRDPFPSSLKYTQTDRVNLSLARV
jgi:hypothetical protein